MGYKGNRSDRHSMAGDVVTEGSVPARMLKFALPVFIGNLFQQMYNMADSLIVGNFCGSTALAAVSSAGNLIYLMVGFFLGLSMGAGVVIARYIGAGDRESTGDAVHTTVAIGLVISVLLTMIGVAFTPQILKLMGTPDNVMPQSVIYFRIYFMGSFGQVMYNMLLAILQAAGDSRHPLYYLAAASVTNVVLDLLFVGVLHGGVGAAALATIISQFFSAALCFNRLIHVDADYRICVKKIKVGRSMLSRILHFGIPSGFQNSIIGFANVVVQSYINFFGQEAMAGAGAYTKIEGFAFLPITSFTLALTTFISQNIGAGKPERARQGARFGTVSAMVLAEIIGVITFVFAPQLIGLFDKTPGVVAYGTGRAQTCALFYVLLAFSHAEAAVLRGAGKPVVPMVIMLVCWCVIRVSILAVTGYVCRSIADVNWVYPITWTLSTITFALYIPKIDYSGKI